MTYILWCQVYLLCHWTIGEYCDPHTTSSVFLILIPLGPLTTNCVHVGYPMQTKGDKQYEIDMPNINLANAIIFHYVTLPVLPPMRGDILVCNQYERVFGYKHRGGYRVPQRTPLYGFIQLAIFYYHGNYIPMYSLTYADHQFTKFPFYLRRR